MKHTTAKQLVDLPLKKHRLRSSISTLALLSLPIFSAVPLASATAAPGTNETQPLSEMTGRHTITPGDKGGNGGDGYEGQNGSSSAGGNGTPGSPTGLATNGTSGTRGPQRGDGSSGLAGNGQLTIESGNYTADSLTIGQADTRYGSENQYLQTGGIFTADNTGLRSGALRVNGGMFASTHLDASRGQMDVMGKGTAIIGTRELNAELWQQGAGWMTQQQSEPFAGTLAIAAGETVDLSSPDLHWSIGSDSHLNRFDDASLTNVSAKLYVDQGSSALLIGDG